MNDPSNVFVASRRKQLRAIEQAYPGAHIIDVTSKSIEPWVRFSPFYPHGGIPIPNWPGAFALSVEGLWQGLKVFEREDVDAAKWMVSNMKNIKRSVRTRGPVLGHRFGIESPVLLSYRDARLQIYLPAFRWVLENHLAKQVAALRSHRLMRSLVLLDYETNADIEDLSRPLSHAALIKHYLNGNWPAASSATFA